MVTYSWCPAVQLPCSPLPVSANLITLCQESLITHHHCLDPLTSSYSPHSPISPPDPAESVPLTCSGTGHGVQSVHQFERWPWCIAINFNGSCPHSPSSLAGMEYSLHEKGVHLRFSKWEDPYSFRDKESLLLVKYQIIVKIILNPLHWF